MKRTVLEGAAAGMAFTALSYLVVTFMGFRWQSLTVLMYLYVALGVIAALYFESDVLEGSIPGLLDRIVVVAEGEQLELKKLVSGEKYRVKGELERL